MENPATVGILGTHDTGQRQTQHRKLKRWATRTQQQTWREPRYSWSV